MLQSMRSHRVRRDLVNVKQQQTASKGVERQHPLDAGTSCTWMMPICEGSSAENLCLLGPMPVSDTLPFSPYPRVMHVSLSLCGRGLHKGKVLGGKDHWKPSQRLSLKISLHSL